MTIRTLSLFAGIGGFDLGLAWAGGFETVAFCEIEPFARRVLAEHWPNVRCYEDVRELTAARLAADGIVVDAIVGGFPCQPHSIAGKREASEDERDLWPHFARLIREIRPRWVVAENVPGLRSSESGRFFGDVLRDLAEARYDCEWRSISAADVGAFHERERVWIVGYPHRPGRQGFGVVDGSERQADFEAERSGAGSRDVGDADHQGRRNGQEGDAGRGEPSQGQRTDCPPGGGGDEVADTDSRGRREQGHGRGPGAISSRPRLSLRARQGGERAHAATAGSGGRTTESRLGGTADGLPEALDPPWGEGWEDGTPRVVTAPEDKVDRRKRLIGLGNAVVPQIVEIIGRAIVAADA